MKKNKKLLIVGDGEFAEIAYEYFTHDSEYEVVAFAVEKAYLKKASLYDLPVINFDDVVENYPPEKCEIFVAITFVQLNRVRTRLYKESKAKGYKMASYISSRAFVWHNAVIGENCFVFENNVIQHCVKIGNNVILWSGNHIGHRSVIKDNCFLSSHVIVSGYCCVNDNCFIGVNATFVDMVIVGEDSFIGAGTLVNRNLDGGSVYSGIPAVQSKVSSYRFFKVC